MSTEGVSAESAYLDYVQVQAQQPSGADGQEAIAASGHDLYLLYAGALAAGQRNASEVESLDPGSPEQTRATIALQQAAGFLAAHHTEIEAVTRDVIRAARKASSSVLAQPVPAAQQPVGPRGRFGATELLTDVRERAARSLFGQQRLLAQAEQLTTPKSPIFSWNSLHYRLISIYGEEGAPKRPTDKSVVDPLIQVGVVEVVKSGAVNYRLVGPAAREEEPTKHPAGIPPRVYLSTKEALVLAAQLRRLHQELDDSGLPTVDEALVAGLSAAVDENFRVTDQQIREMRRTIADKVGRLRAAPRLIVLLKESLPPDDARQDLLDYLAAIPRAGLRLFRGYVGESTIAVSYAEIRSAIRGAGPALGDVRVRRNQRT